MGLREVNRYVIMRTHVEKMVCYTKHECVCEEKSPPDPPFDTQMITPLGSTAAANSLFTLLTSIMRCCALTSTLSARSRHAGNALMNCFVCARKTKFSYPLNCTQIFPSHTNYFVCLYKFAC